MTLKGTNYVEGALRVYEDKFESELRLETDLKTVLGARSATLFATAFDIHTVFDLVSHYPRRYATRGALTPIVLAEKDEYVTIVGEIISASQRRLKARKGNILQVLISDGQRNIALTFFNQLWKIDEFVAGRRGLFSGKIAFYNGLLQLSHPEYELFADDVAKMSEQEMQEWTQKPLPIYPATRNATNVKIQKAMVVVLDQLGQVESGVPLQILQKRHLLEYRQALEYIHRPENMQQKQLGRASLRFQEGFVLQAALRKQRQNLQDRSAKPRQVKNDDVLRVFDARLPFELTPDQHEVGERIAQELRREHPMQRLIQGEVGSGKTVVALRAMLIVSQTGGQCAFLAPTEVLAGQHMASLVDMLGQELIEKLKPVVLIGSISVAQRKKALLAIAAGTSKIIVGTHALLSDGVSFADLGLVVIDEQHRFGVEQREKLRAKSKYVPHLIILTATPIPRTIAMTVFGDVDVSTMKHVPKERAGVKTFVVERNPLNPLYQRVWSRCSEEMQKGHQIFVVCPAIFAAGQRVSVEGMLEYLLAKEIFKGRNIAPLHGELCSEEKEEVMIRFRHGEIDMLVCTTIIEVGVDVPNATVMVVCEADRFGISQLHQLRGRVGRGSLPGLCLLLTQNTQDESGYKRLQAVAATTDGFKLAIQDLEMRKEGDILGTRQSGGKSSLRLLRVVKDEALIVETRKEVYDFFPEVDDMVAFKPLQRAIERHIHTDSQTFLSKY